MPIKTVVRFHSDWMKTFSSYSLHKLEGTRTPTPLDAAMSNTLHNYVGQRKNSLEQGNRELQVIQEYPTSRHFCYHSNQIHWVISKNNWCALSPNVYLSTCEAFWVITVSRFHYFRFHSNHFLVYQQKKAMSIISSLLFIQLYSFKCETWILNKLFQDSFFKIISMFP